MKGEVEEKAAKMGLYVVERIESDMTNGEDKGVEKWRKRWVKWYERTGEGV